MHLYEAMPYIFTAEISQECQPPLPPWFLHHCYGSDTPLLNIASILGNIDMCFIKKNPAGVHEDE